MRHFGFPARNRARDGKNGAGQKTPRAVLLRRRGSDCSEAAAAVWGEDDEKHRIGKKRNSGILREAEADENRLIDPIHRGVVMIVNLAIGLFTPPVGVNLYVACGIGKISIEDISKGISPCLVAMLIVLLLVTYIPAISLMFV